MSDFFYSCGSTGCPSRSGYASSVAKLLPVAAVALMLLCWTSFDSARFLALCGSPPALVSGVDLPREAPVFPRDSIEDICDELGAGPPPRECPLPEKDLKAAALELAAAGFEDDPDGLPGAGKFEAPPFLLRTVPTGSPGFRTLPPADSPTFAKYGLSAQDLKGNLDSHSVALAIPTEQKLNSP